MQSNDPTIAADSSPDATLIRNITSFTRAYFQNPKFDASHDFDHVMRVTNNAQEILKLEQERRKSQSLPALDRTTVLLGALLHDVGDKKYINKRAEGVPEAQLALLKFGVREEFATKISDLVSGVSFSAEVRDPRQTARLIAEIPELAVVQDADRLDAIGAVGIGRCFTFGGAKGRSGLGSAIEHFEEKLLKLESMMKTETGRAMAAERSKRIREFMDWWKEEVGPASPVDNSGCSN